MPVPKILIIPGSTRIGSLNVKLGALAAKDIALEGVEVTRISLADYPMPLYDADLEREHGVLSPALKLKQLICAHQGVFITSPEYNASVTPLLKNAIDWVGNTREPGEPTLAAYQNRVFALGAATPGPAGGTQSLLALRQILAVGCRALVVAEQIAVPFAKQAFDDMGELRESVLAGQLRLVLRKLIDLARMMGRE
jgi:chromate reductase